MYTLIVNPAVDKCSLHRMSTLLAHAPPNMLVGVATLSAGSEY